MDRIKYLRYTREASRIMDIIETCLQKEVNCYSQYFKEVEVDNYYAGQYTGGEFHTCKRPPLYDEDWVIEDEATNYVLIGSSNAFRALEITNNELTLHINRLIHIYEVCERYEDEYPSKFNNILKKHTEITAKVKYANRYVVE